MSKEVRLSVIVLSQVERGRHGELVQSFSVGSGYLVHACLPIHISHVLKQ